jgi:hypothetical protein
VAVEIPIQTDVNAFTERIQLDGNYYTLTFRWNERALRWYLDLADGDGAAIASGIALVTGVPLTYHLRATTGMPQGTLVCVDTDESGVDPAFDELGNRVKLIYLTEDEAEEALD